MALSGVGTSLNVSSQYSVASEQAVLPQPKVPGGGTSHVSMGAPRDMQYPVQQSPAVRHIAWSGAHVGPASITGVSQGPSYRYGRVAHALGVE